MKRTSLWLGADKRRRSRAHKMQQVFSDVAKLRRRSVRGRKTRRRAAEWALAAAGCGRSLMGPEAAQWGSYEV